MATVQSQLSRRTNSNTKQRQVIQTSDDGLEEVGHEALLFVYGHNVNIYSDVFSIPPSSSAWEIHQSYQKLLQKLEFALNAFSRDSDVNDKFQTQSALLWGMKPSQLAAGMHPRIFIEIKIDAVKRAYQILADSSSRQEYDFFLREHLHNANTLHRKNFNCDASCDESELVGESFASDDDDDESNNTVTLYEDFEDEEVVRSSSHDGTVSSNEYKNDAIAHAQTLPDSLVIHSINNDEVFDPFNLYDEVYSPSASTRGQEPPELVAPVTPDFSYNSIDMMDEDEKEATTFVCSLPNDDDSSNASVMSEEDLDDDDNLYGAERIITSGSSRLTNLEPEEEIHLDVSVEEEEEMLDTFRSIAKSISAFDEEKEGEKRKQTAMDQKQTAFFAQMNQNPEDEIDCFRNDGSCDNSENNDDMSYESFDKETEVDDDVSTQSAWPCVGACFEEMAGAVDDINSAIDQMCGRKRC
ncbi:predicted protein [Thalassiosira pseudonana CCMP1335]|uniref:J domain-containing protein n=1 Tax=Thalassiosira pseudonana TaxID=35128 RepID=B8BSG4_THAPS|nr:predicted protein [Thalassiosira pseudonana CCMP1335]EED96717.1 predicted protein [Thalassiosira pseudonana CCMP1335]